MDSIRRRGGRLAVFVSVVAIIAAACGGSTATNAPSGAGTPSSAPASAGAATAGPATAGPATPGPTPAGSPKQGGKLVAAIEGEPTSVDPAFDYDFVSGLATSSITEPLLVFCKNDT